MNMWDHSNILMGNRAGANMGAGITQAAQSIGMGIEGYRREKKKKEEDEAAAQYLKLNGAKFGLNVQDDGEIKAAIKAAGGGKEAISLVTAIQQMEQQKKAQEQQQLMAAMQMKQMEAAQRAEEQERAALKAAVAPRQRTAAEGLYINKSAMRDPSSDEVVSQYLRGGGTTKGAGGLVDTITAMNRMREDGESFQPQLFDLGAGVSAMSTSKKSAVPVDRGTNKSTGAGPIYTADGKFYKSREDDEWKPAPRERPLDFVSFQLGVYDGDSKDQSAIQSAYREYVRSFSKEDSGPQPRVDKATGADSGPVAVTTKEQFDKLKPGTRFTFNGRTGIKK